MVRKIRTVEVPSAYDELLAPSLSSRVSIGIEDKIQEYFQVGIEDIMPYEKQARKVFSEEEINQLAETIAIHGVRQPLTIVKANTIGRYHVISGERRLRAAKIAGLETVPCILLNTEDNIEEIALIENIQREDLHPIELASAYASLLSGQQYGELSALASRLGVSKSHISETLSYNNLPQEIKDHLLTNNIRTRSILRNLLQQKNLEQMRNILGLADTKIKKIKERALLKISVNQGKISINQSSLRLTDDLKKQLRQELLKFLEAIDKV